MTQGQVSAAAVIGTLEIYFASQLKEADLPKYTAKLAFDLSNTYITLISGNLLEPNGTEIASGGLPSILDIAPNSSYYSLAPFVEQDSEANVVIQQAFHRSHVWDWCSRIDIDYASSLRARASSEGKGTAQCSACSLSLVE